MTRIKILDSLRGLAALLVVFHHFYTRLPHLFLGLDPFFIRWLNVISELNVEAVLFFFILSGFSIRLSLRDEAPFDEAGLNEYLYRRFKRILPLYFIALLITFIAGLIIQPASDTDYSVKTLVGNIFFLQISKPYSGYWFAPYGNNGPLWSLPFEMFYYLFFPLYVWVLNKIFRLGIYADKVFQYSLIISLGISLGATLINKHYFFPYIAYSTLFYSWYVGFFIAHLYKTNAIKVNKNLLLLLANSMLLMLVFYFSKSSTSMKLLETSILSVLIFFVIVLMDTGVKRFFKMVESILNALFHFAGKGSYALYLLHYPVLLLFIKYQEQSFLEVCLGVAVLIIVCKYLEEFLVRKKFLFLKMRYIK